MEKQQKTLIERLIFYSKEIIGIIITIGEVTKLKTLLNRLNVRLFSKSNLDSLMEELERRKTELETACKFILRPIVQGKDLGFDKVNKWSFSSEELLAGFALLYEQNGEKWVIPFSDIKEIGVKAGELVKFERVKAYLTSLPPVISHKDLYYKLTFYNYSSLTKKSNENGNGNKNLRESDT